ncbi:MAG: FAD-dependent oxidoreductase [Pseudomonadota bacterium]
MGQLPIIIIGAGISGLSLAKALVDKEQAVLVVEAGKVGSGASGAAAAYLEPRTGTGGLRAIEWESLKRWPAYAQHVAESTGTDLDYRTEGLIHVAREDGLPRLQREFEQRKAAGTPVTWLSGDEARETEPALSPDILAGYSLHQVHTLDARAFCAAMAALLVQMGVEVSEETHVLSITTDGDELLLDTSRGERRAAKVVLCCAMGRNHIEGLPDDVPLSRPVRGVMLDLAEDEGQPLVSRMVKHSKGVICPRTGGRLLVGPTSEKGETSLLVDDDVIAGLLETAGQFIPAVAKLDRTNILVGIRALIGDGALKLGQSRAVPGVYYSLSHGGSGFLRAPVVAEELADYLLNEAASCPLTSAYLTRL